MDNIIVWLWAVIIIAWSVKTAVDQNKRNRRRNGSARSTATVSQHAETATIATGKPQRTTSTEVIPTYAASQQHTGPSDNEMAPILTAIADDLARLSGRRSAPTTTDTPPSSATGQAKANSVATKNDAASAIEDILGGPFDLRQAVLYSEILKPKFDE